MAASASGSNTNKDWFPADKTEVQIGSSMTKWLLARRNEPVKAKFPSRDFYQMRHSFKPNSLNPDGNGVLRVKEAPQGSAERIPVEAEFPTTSADRTAVYTGYTTPMKDVMCLLVYDNTTNKYTLEKMDSDIELNYDKVVATKPRSLASTETSTPTHKAKARSFEDDFDEILPESLVSARPTAHVEDEEEGEVTAAPPVRPPSPPKPVPKKAPPKANLPPKPKVLPVPQPEPKPRPEPKAKLEPKPKPEPKAKAKPKVNLKRASAATQDVEELEIHRPSPPKRPKPAMVKAQPAKLPPPPPRVPAPLELPGSSTSYAQPLPAPNAIPLIPPLADSDEDEDEDDWDPVEAPTDAAAEAPTEDIEMFSLMLQGELEEVHDDLEQEQDIDLEEEEEEEEDFLLRGMEEEELPSEAPQGGPISLNQFAGGAADYDDYSSSGSDSDDD